ncbi:2-phosphosulfolactate phosphatase [Saccharopolyspora antimicrobica]|uniref:Probable 2-phosphosulfolactate phosphatase n=1 Tax=Saccharopolyspora antimicrobica TaxID=455193 RepID=A0A1I4Z1W6_9PSEU|nr:2-phosphosulfolactate phosphatase [Saccharopolyspora antimicrobica]RKT82894.1 2-phosphosulfolactate phosphatase [Saccharopolyspora antimicrobica]SFN44157.1 2-phosphosulfolactate phosphatase [Saccharopolyspora antimicrobica]
MTSVDVHVDWGLPGLRAMSEFPVLVIVDVLSFSTAVDIATSRGARVLPMRSRYDTIPDDIVLAWARSHKHWSLSPSSLQTIPSDARLGLPSPNGATLCSSAGNATVFAGCLRNAEAVAAAAARVGGPVGVVAGGERRDGELRPAIEDLLGAGAIITALPGRRSPEAELAAAAFVAVRDNVADLLADCDSGRELAEMGFAHDVDLAAAVNASRTAPVLRDGFLEAS